MKIVLCVNTVYVLLCIQLFTYFVPSWHSSLVMFMIMLLRIYVTRTLYKLASPAVPFIFNVDIDSKKIITKDLLDL